MRRHAALHAAAARPVVSLTNGNVLVAAGVLSATVKSHIFEVGKTDGKVVWELQLPNFHGAYRAIRITPPLVHAPTP